jgi:sulfide dehydrogenase cytochrome subunit
MSFRSHSALFLFVFLASAAAAETPPPGATSCSGCHVAGDASPILDLGGRPIDEVIAAMAAFREGKRPATVMDRIARGFTPEETRAIAEWLVETK